MSGWYRSKPYEFPSPNNQARFFLRSTKQEIRSSIDIFEKNIVTYVYHPIRYILIDRPSKDGLFHFKIPNMKKVIVYIDGFNIYHAIHDLGQPKLKWLNLWSLSESFLRQGEQLVGVKYFSAYQTKRADAYQRHRIYVKALVATGVTVEMGNFKYKHMSCRRCSSSWKQPEEKETDVHIAVSMVSDALLDNFDRGILISADSDLVPAKNLINRNCPHKEFFVAAPPGRYTAARALAPKMEITVGRLRKNRLPDNITDPSGTIIVSVPPQYL